MSEVAIPESSSVPEISPYEAESAKGVAGLPLPTDGAASRIITIPATLKTVMKSLKPVPERTVRRCISTRSQAMPTATPPGSRLSSAKRETNPPR